MAAQQRDLRLTDLARAGFQELTSAREQLDELAACLSVPAASLLDPFAHAADPDAALIRARQLGDRHPEVLAGLDAAQFERLCLLFGSSPALGDFFARQPGRLAEILQTGGRLIRTEEARRALVEAVRGAPVGAGGPLAASALAGEPGWLALRVRYRELLAELMLHDLREARAGRVEAAFEPVAHALSDLAGGAVEASLAVARASLLAGLSGPAVPAERLSVVDLAVVAMGKCGAEELNVVSDVDVVFIVGTSDEEVVDGDALIRISTRLASETMRGIHDPAIEPPLWELDANLRPEGRHGALVRTLGSMLHYYERWAKGWEFQALLKARPLAGDRGLGEAFVAGTRELVWSSSSREDFVGSVQRMRQRVTEHIADDELEVQLKLGPGGLRDIEFSVQLLQLVHGQYDERLHLRGTLPALRALVEGGYIARSDGERLASDYRRLRTLEHRLQLRELRRTAIMPRDEESLRVLARSTGLADTWSGLLALWELIKREVRELHLKIFYAPLLSAVAALPEEELVLGSDEARARLSSIGFRDPDGAIRHLSALTRGTSRRARIQRNLMPVMLQWLAEGTDPDFGLLSFRRVSEANQGNPWYLRLLRDGTDAAERLARVLSCSRYAAELLESIPEAVAWLEKDDRLQPLGLPTLLEEMRAIASRRDSAADSSAMLRTVHRREVLRLALGRIVGAIDDRDVALGLDAAHTALLDGLLIALRRDEAAAAPAADPLVELALIGMGRYGGRELGFASDIDIVAVFRAADGVPAEQASRAATKLVSELRRLVSDPRFPVDLDFDLRPEGKNGPIVRSLDAYRAYYERWSVTWEAQALLRARHVAGDAALGADFIALADEIRYPAAFGDAEVREVRRIKARVEAERLPQGADRRRHLKLGPGGISDVEWLVQLIQLREGRSHPALRTVSTLEALVAARDADLLAAEDTEQLTDSWRFASRIRSALKLWTGRASDSLPTDWADLEGIAGVLGLPGGRTSELEERWFAVSRRARAVFEREFFGYEVDERFPGTW
ncbi:bifunctional [glutamine synthetase] adenylyltransferase/[glutamine synthetase]-adenylyl-L-tyrosine phosphorylase [Leucobacter rhizosphaerae]|uniref:Bifunctional [glutamine synthetase] adenylyltransferase/[glutamine synthetase]-adenylyl-L-tyrosine phosphorylase n=1 Tax=Leucobacter rhizosphaerae TaxID=2932245 RepID=A0ABY4FX62_9MICO|nr:bifunctional [glutamine synthetase] adenylyltransferase/[glutamine synthetase]-adenylyl-L-tyrosine phosphorylase [Leucobacter rhizosphaerae]UOQ60885.1 bifunctional [glutamine synthetase] adenylyltransferase/[glutamine synthetase]-adenylyl-L-tyrosine phosphorylase [Leucobacter rhizosphaerae]